MVYIVTCVEVHFPLSHLVQVLDLVDTELLYESSRLWESFTQLLKTVFFKRVQHDPVVAVFGLLVRVLDG